MKPMTRIMKLAVAALAVLTLVPGAASAQVNVTGAWVVDMVSPQGPTTVDVNMKQDGEALTGELTTPLGVAPFKGTLVKDALKVVAAIDMQGTALELTFTAKVTGDTLAGTVKFGDFGEAPFTGKRKAGAPAAAAAAARPAPAAAGASAGINGNWTIILNIQGMEIPLAATFTMEGGKVTGTLTSDQGAMSVAGTMTGNALKLEFTAPGDLAVVMTGDLGASGLAGKMNIAGLGDADWTGQRSK
jgi:hypothetical protein